MRFVEASDSAVRANAVRVGAAVLTLAACALGMAACGVASSGPGSAGSAPSSPAAGSTPSSPAPGSTPSAGTSPAGTDACTITQLQVSLTHTGALGGQAGGYLRFTNDSTTACQMDGWPAVIALTGSGKATTLKHAQSTMYGAWHVPATLPAMKLQPGDSAYAVLAADDQPAGAASCPAPYVRLRVSPPGSSGSVVVSAWLPGAGTDLPACAAVNGSPTGEVSAITPLSSLPH
jgi:hypothetical protein